jgi:PAS domain S-box-containing protein
LQEERKKALSQTEGLESRKVTILINSRLISLSGKWDWDLHAAAVFCSDVMLALPPRFEGTLGIIHPDDASSVKEKLFLHETITGLCFRLITTYGEVHTLCGQDLQTEEAGQELEPRENLLQHTIQAQEETREKQQLYLKSRSAEFGERITRSGAWYINTTTNETWYSDNVFRIYGLPAQSLNSHPNTFSAFVHPDDRPQVEEAFHRAYREQLPLHLRFRIVARDEIRHVSQATHWSNTAQGQVILHGIIEDVTEEVRQEDSLEQALQDTGFQKQLLLFSEQSAQVGFWQVNLVTRKTECSDNYYRIFGLRPQALAGSPKFLLINYVHPDDSEKVEEADRKLRREHTAQDVEFRIIRPDGKTRYLRQRGKVVLYGGEPVMVGIIQDVTQQKILERKLAELQEAMAVRNFIHWQAEEMANTGSWSLELDTGLVSWSENFYHLLGYKPNSVEITQRHLLKLVHPEDRKKFTDAMSLAQETEQGMKLEFRLAHLGVTHYIKAIFRHLRREGKELLIATIQDITQEHLLKQELHRRAHLAESLTDNILDRVVITDTDNSILLWNKRCEEAYGVRKDKAIGRNFFDVMPALRTAGDIALFNRALSGEAVHQSHRQSSIRREFHDLHMVPLRDEEGTVTGVLHMVHDVTREFELNQNLSERLSFIEKLVESSVDQIIVLDRNVNYLYWNKKCEELYGLSQKEVVGRNVLEVFPNSPHNPSYEDFRKALKGETVYIPGRDDQQQGSYREVYLIPIKNEKEEVASVLWITHDLTNEYLLRLEQQRGARLMNSISEAYVELDRDNVFRYINHRAEELWKIDREDWLGKSIQGLLEQLVEPEGAAIITSALESKASAEGEYYSHSAEAWLYLSATPAAEGLIILFYDITEIKETREKLQREHQRLQEAQAIGRLGSWEYDIATGAFSWSEGMYRLFDLPKDTPVTPEIYLEYAASSSMDAARRIVGSIREKFGSFEETLEVDRNGLKRILLVKGTVIHNEKGEPEKLLGIDLDVTAAREAEKKINETLRKLSLQNSIYEYAEDIARLGTWSWSLDTDMVNYSGNMFLLFGTEPGPAKADFFTFRDLIHPDDLQPLLSIAMDLKENEEPRAVEYRVNRSDGERRIFRNRCTIIRHQQTGERMLIGTTQDITEEHELRRQLLERTHYAESLINASADRMFVLDRSLVIHAWNGKCEEYYGHKRETMLGRPLPEAFPAMAENKGMMTGIQRAFKGGHGFMPATRESDMKVVTEFFFIPLKNEQGETHSVLCVLHDVTRAVQAQEKLEELNKSLEQKNRELERKNEEITAFAFVASHDLKEPLRKVHTFSDWLQEREAGSLSAQGKQYLDKIASAVRRMDLLIEDILVLTRIHTDNRPADDINLDTVLSGVMTEMKDVIASSGAEIEASGLGDIRGNASQVAHLFRNLLDNSIKFHKPGTTPKITISSSLIKAPHPSLPEAEVGREYLELCFSDNGIGFEQKYERKVFKMFQRIHYHHQSGGTGMGLAISKKIMSNHEGFITVKSEVNEGAVFCCYFPLT